VLSSVGGEKVTTVEELFGVLRRYEPGQSVKIAYVRGGEERTAQVRISDRPA
jgi:S1-C subfamily serine protease